MSIGSSAGTTLGSMGATVISAVSCTTLDSNHDINQMSTTVGADASVDTALGANHAISQVGSTVGTGASIGTTLGANHGFNQIGATMGSALGSNSPE